MGLCVAPFTSGAFYARSRSDRIDRLHPLPQRAGLAPPGGLNRLVEGRIVVG